MTLTRRKFVGSGVGLAATLGLPGLAGAQEPIRTRRSISQLTRQQLQAFRLGVHRMMELPSTDKRSWVFQAHIHGVDETLLPQEMHQFARYHWNKCPHSNYFFLSWHRMYLYFFERILRHFSGDPNFALPYWDYLDPAQTMLPVAFRPDELGTAPQAVPTYRRNNPLARATRHPAVDSGSWGLGTVIYAGELLFDRFWTTERTEANFTYCGASTDAPRTPTGFGHIEAVHNYVHGTIGVGGADMAQPETAARDPIFWLHHANIDRLWANWQRRRGPAVLPLNDANWMDTEFIFADENGRDHPITSRQVIDYESALGYRYDRLSPFGPADDTLAAGVGASDNRRLAGGAAEQRARAAARTAPVTLASAPRTQLASGQTAIRLTAIAGVSAAEVATADFRVVLNGVTAQPGTSPYDVFLAGPAASVGVGTLSLFASSSHGGHGVAVAFDATLAVRQLAPQSVLDTRSLSVLMVQRGPVDAFGRRVIIPDPNPPVIDNIELVKV